MRIGEEMASPPVCLLGARELGLERGSEHAEPVSLRRVSERAAPLSWTKAAGCVVGLHQQPQAASLPPAHSICIQKAAAFQGETSNREWTKL